MPLIVTPGQLSRFSEFYHQIGSMLGAGLGLTQALDQMQRSPPSPFFRPRVRYLLQFLERGGTFTEALTGLGNWLPSFDLALIGAGERSGRLDVCCQLLAEYYRERSQLARKVISDLAYPVFMLHAGVFIFPFAQFFVSGDLAVYLAQTVGILAPLYLAVGLLIFACQGKHGERWRAMVELVVSHVPLLGKARSSLALGRLAAALEALLNAGVPIIEAWELAAAASGSPALRREVSLWRPRIESGTTPAELLQHSTTFPEVFANLYSTGEISGTVDTTLKRLYTYYRDEGERKMRAVAEWTPKIIYIAILLAIAYKIVMFWTGYFNQLSGIVGG